MVPVKIGIPVSMEELSRVTSYCFDLDFRFMIFRTRKDLFIIDAVCGNGKYLFCLDELQ